MINILDNWFKESAPQKIIVHCQAGISRSQAVALFISRYYYKSEKLFYILNNLPKIIKDGNDHVYSMLTEAYEEKHGPINYKEKEKLLEKERRRRYEEI